jgi:hypothetical protein
MYTNITAGNTHLLLTFKIFYTTTKQNTPATHEAFAQLTRWCECDS